MSREVLRETSQKEIAGFKPDFNATQKMDVPTVLRYSGGRVRWNLPGNTPEENEQIGIQNIQGIILERFPEFNELFPRGEDGKIAEQQREKAREFILQNMGSVKKIRKLIGSSSVSKAYVPYFSGNYKVVLTKSFSQWGITFEWEEPAPEGWMTNGALTSKIGRASAYVAKLANQFRSAHPERFKIYIDSANVPNEHFSPELAIQIITESSRIEPAPEGWMTNKAVAGQLGKDFSTVRKIADQYRGDHQEWFKQRLNAIGRPNEHYSSELVGQIAQEALKIQQAPDGWVTNEALAKRLGKDSSTIKRVADQYSTDRPEWFRKYLMQGRAHRPHTHYSPELVEQIIKIINEQCQQEKVISPDQAREDLWKYVEVEENSS